MKLLTVILLSLIMVSAASAKEYRYSLGGGVGQLRLTGGDFFSYSNQTSPLFSLGHRLSGRWGFELDYASAKFSNNTAVDSTGTVLGMNNNLAMEISLSRIGLQIFRRFRAPERFVNITAGLGGGLMVWKAVEPTNQTTLTVTGEKNEPTDFAASEMFVTGSAGLSLRLRPRWTLSLISRADYLTGAGAEFDPTIKSARDRLVVESSVRLLFHFGKADARSKWKSDESWSQAADSARSPRRLRRDADGDGVADQLDKCLSTPRGAKVDANGCPLDGDLDGVADGLDDCPGTAHAARHHVDIHGCPIDSDFDGIPDFQDGCAFNQVGAQVDDHGCPLDSDNDGVPDGLDDCPYTLVDVEVDKHGCIDLAMFSKPMIINIDYAPGSFEIDPHNRERLKRLAGLLNFVADIKLDISGYTDNIGSSGANRILSEKRANRVRGLLVGQGIDGARIKVFGRGEANFVASNQTAAGRAKNRRIEILFHK